MHDLRRETYTTYSNTFAPADPGYRGRPDAERAPDAE